jgi:hypothetical protein
MIEKPKKERRFLKTLGKIGEILLQEVLIKIGSSLIKRIGGKKTLPSILFLFLSISLFAQYPATGNKQRLGYQTSGDGVVWRGRASDTVALKSSTINNSYVILDTINNVMLVYIKTKGGWKYNNADTIIVNNNTDTTSLSSRINLKLNISDTASMLTNYLRTGVAASTYLTQSSAASTYLPLTGGTLTGGLNGTTANFVGNFGIGTNTPLNLLEVSKSNNGTSTSLRITNSFSETGSTDETADIDFYQGSSGGYFTSGRVRSFREGDYLSANTQITGGLSFWTQTSNAIPANGFTEKMRITSIGSVGIGTTTPQSTLEVHGSAVFNEGSVNSDFRVESDGNVNMVFVDASTDRVGIGTNAPTKTLEVNGTFNATGDITEGGLNVLTSSDTASLSSRIDAINSGGNQISANNNTTQTISNLTGISNYYLGITSNSTITITLPSVSINVNKMITIKNTGTGAVNSSSSNVQPLKDPIPPNTLINTSEILISGGGKWTTIVSNGYEWVKMAGN